jgi:hypothetical protein
LAQEIVDDKVTPLLKLRQPSANMPNPFPHAVPLGLGKLAAEVTIGSYWVIAQGLAAAIGGVRKRWSGSIKHLHLLR